ncbi:phosphoribosyltransferase [Candidatus Woesearchaeota archaeon]|nr:phosphoribosyltransferase [Candidatus Woesearchaeota archaeon]
MINKTSKIFAKEYQKFLSMVVGKDKARKYKIVFLPQACAAAKELKKEYDIGIALATGGLFMGFVAEKFGLKVIKAKPERKGKETSWKFLDKIKKGEIRNKKIIVFDIDVVTGRTLRKAIKEIKTQIYGLAIRLWFNTINPERISRNENFYAKKI